LLVWLFHHTVVVALAHPHDIGVFEVRRTGITYHPPRYETH
jgi:hypothetical protein